MCLPVQASLHAPQQVLGYRSDGMLHISACLPACLPACLCACLQFRFNIPGMGGREDWGRSEEDLMRARGAVDEVLVCMGLAPAHFDETLRTRVGAGAGNLP